MVRRRFGILLGGIAIFYRNHGFERAAAISFYAFFSMIPMLLFIVAGLGFILGTRTGLLDRVIELARISVPYLSDAIINDLRGLAKAWKTFGWLSILVLLLSAEMVLNSVADALISIFEMRGRFGFFRKKITNISVVCLAVFASFFSLVVTAAAGILRRPGLTVFDFDLGYYLIDSVALKYILPFVIVVSAVTFVFRVFSGPNLNTVYALWGALIFSVIWEGAKHLFALYISYFPYYNKFYGSLGTIMVLLIWLFFSANIFLFSASVARSAFIERR